MGTNKINVLIFPAEGVNAIELHDALSYCVNIRVFGASSVQRSGRFIFESYISNLPKIEEEGFIDAFNRILETYNIDFVFPTHDTVARFLVDNSALIQSKIISGDKRTVDICRSKIRTHELFQDCPFAPIRYFPSNITASSFPVFSKPDEGQGAVGACLISDEESLSKISFLTHLVTEYLPGKEYTVDCFTDVFGNLRYISPRIRERIIAGVSVSGVTIPVTEEIQIIAEAINHRLNFLGLWYFQVREDKKGALKLLEVSCRCSGSMALTRAKGINLPLLSVYTALGRDVSVFDNGSMVELERYYSGSYCYSDIHYTTVYIDFDDTIITNGKVNLNVIRFLFQCRNNNKNIILLTKHMASIEDSLSKFAVSEKLFSRIIRLDENESKIDYISPIDSIFIDNMFSERKVVHDKYGIPVFDVDQVEFLLDRRN